MKKPIYLLRQTDMKKEPKQFIGAKKLLVDCSGIWEAIYDLDKRINHFEKVQTITNYFFMFSIILSVSTLVTIYLFKL